MKRIIRIKAIYLIILIALLLSACQPTPKKEAVAAKEDIYTLTKERTVDSQDYAHDKEWKEEVAADDTGVTINFNCGIETPEDNVYPVMSVKRTSFSKETAEKLINYFMPEAKFYTNIYQETKEQLTTEMLAYSKRILNDEDECPESKDELEASRKQKMEEYKQKIAEAPKQIEKKYVTLDSLIDSKTLSITDNGKDAGAELKNGQDAFFSVNNMSDNVDNSSFYFGKGLFVQTEKVFGQNIEGITETEDKAKGAAQQALNDLSIKGMSLVSIEKAQLYDKTISNIISKGYYMIYRCQVDELKTIYINEDINWDPGNLPEYMAPWPQEEICIYADDNGIEWFFWQGLSDIEQTVSKNVTLLPFSDVKERILKQLKYNNFWTKKSKAQITINVNRIVIGLALESKKDDTVEGLLAPVWYVIYDLKLGSTSQPDALVLNAIDGSVIEPRLTSKDVAEIEEDKKDDKDKGD